jgi:UDP-galactopyranose mutase
MKTALVIGGGIAGCAAAHQLALAGGWNVTLVERTSELGAGNRTKYWGGHPYTFGPRHFLTPHEKVFLFLDHYVPLRRCPEHEALTYVESDSAFYNFPIHMDDVKKMPDASGILAELADAPGPEGAKNLEDYWIQSVGMTLYKKFVEKYNKKMWMLDSNRVHDTFSWSAKGVTIQSGKERSFFNHWISAYPYAHNGYDDYFDIATESATVLLNTSINHYDFEKSRVFFSGEWRKYDVIINTLSLDDIYNNTYGRLKYIGLDLQLLVLPTEFSFPENVYFLYYANEEPFKRLVEYKKFTRHVSPTTLIGIEYPSLNGRYYPLRQKSEIARHQRYQDLLPSNVFSIGRQGTYDYSVDIDDCILQAMQVADKLNS